MNKVFILLFLSLLIACFQNSVVSDELDLPPLFPDIFGLVDYENTVISSACQQNGSILFTSLAADAFVYQLCIYQCILSGLQDNSTSIKCQNSSSTYYTNYKGLCTNSSATLCSISLESTNNTQDFDFTYGYCIPKICNSTDLKVLTTRLNLHFNKTTSFIPPPLNFKDVILKASLKCGGLSPWVIILIVVVIAVAILLAIVIVVVVLRRRRADDYTPISTGGSDYGSGGYQPQQGY